MVAIQHLVAAAVPGLKPSAISIVDNWGTLLARGTADDASSLTAGTAETEAVIEADSLVEEVSIDGMCGVY